MNTNNMDNFPSKPWFSKWILLEENELRPLLLAAIYFFFLLMSFYLLRPVREAMGIAKGADKLPWLMTATMVVMLIANPAYAVLVSRMTRRKFIPIISHFFAFNLLIFIGLYQFLPSHGGSTLGYAFYVWISVFNLFVVSIFWSLMTDIFSEDQGKRLFGMISVGGTLGAITGAALTEYLSKGSAGFKIEASSLMLLALLALEISVFCMQKLAHHFSLNLEKLTNKEPNHDFSAGLRMIAKSHYLQMICLYILLFTITSTLLYLKQGEIVAASFTEQSERTAAFARMDFWGNIITLIFQLFITSRLLRHLGVASVLLILPLLTLVGFGVLSIWPSFLSLAILQTLRRGMHYAVDRPAREILYIPLGPEERYKSKPFIDTFVYRGGDVMGVWAPTLLTFLAIPVGITAIATAAVWLFISRYLGKLLKQL